MNPHRSRGRAGGSSQLAPAPDSSPEATRPMPGGDVHPWTLRCLWMQSFFQTILSLLLQALQNLASVWEISLTSFANANLAEATPREGGGRERQIKAAFSHTG